jgi:hypothetical protein
LRRGGRNGAKLRSLSWWREFRLQCTKHQPKLTDIAADISATRRNNIHDFPFWQEKNFVEVKRLNVTPGFLRVNREFECREMNLFISVERPQLSDNIGTIE